MVLSVLDVYVLSLLDRGLETPYDLQRQGGLSLGASTPSLQRLVKAKFVERAKGESATKRPRHQYKLTPPGKREARAAWKPFLDENDAPPDIDSILRVADMAAHYGADKPKIRSLLKRASDRRYELAQHADVSTMTMRSGDRRMYMSMRVRCDAGRLRAEAHALRGISWLFRPKGEIEGEQSLLTPPQA